MTVQLKEIADGAALKIAALVEESKCPFLEKMASIGAANPNAYSKFMAMLKVAAKQGLNAFHKERIENLGGGLYEFKEHSAGIRVFGFYDQHRRKLIILHKTWIKAGKDKQQSRVIEKARAEMAQLKAMGQLPFEDMGTRQ